MDTIEPTEIIEGHRQLETIRPQPLARMAGASFAQPQNLTEAMEFAKVVAQSDLAPKDYRGKPGNILIAWQMGAEVGLAMMQSLQNISVINGRAAVWGDAMLALVQSSGLMDWIDEHDNGEVATCSAQRKGYPHPTTRSFSLADAKAAGLLGKDGPWKQYPARMRQMRARAFALRDGFADVLRGIGSAEEISDYPASAIPPPMPAPMPSARPPIQQPRAKAPEPVIEAAFSGYVETDTEPNPPSETTISEYEPPLMITGIDTKTGEKNGKPWSRYTVRFSDGTAAATFSDTIFEQACSAHEDGLPVKIETTPAKDSKYAATLVSLSQILPGQQ